MNEGSDIKANAGIDLIELITAFEAEVSGLRWFLDRVTGNVYLVTHEYDPRENGGLTVDDLETNKSRFALVPSPTPEIALDDMISFARQIADLRLRETLEIALSAARPERRFRAVLGWLPERQQDWLSFRKARCEARAHTWLEQLGVDYAP